MNVAVIGSAGSIHAHTTRALLAQWHRQRILAMLAARIDGSAVLPYPGS